MTYDDDLLARLTVGVQAVLPQWGVGSDAQLVLLTISENATYLVRDQGRQFIIRVHRPNYHSEAEIAAELAWITDLRAKGVVSTPKPLATKNGAHVVSFADGLDTRHAVAFDYMAGSEPNAGDDLPRWYRHLGAITARLHTHARAWERPVSFVRKSWTFDTMIGPAGYWGDWREAQGLEPAGLSILEQVHERLRAQTAAFGHGADRFGLIHCDMRPANLLVDGDRMSVIDFDDCGLCWFAYDFAASVSFMEHDPIIPELMQAWCEGYRSIAHLDDVQVQELPMFVMLRRMQLLAWIASHAETPTAKAMGEPFTHGTVELGRVYLATSGAEAAA